MSTGNATRPIASYFLTNIGLKTGDYTDKNGDGVYTCEGEKILYGVNPLHYKVSGTQYGEWITLEMTLTNNTYEDHYRSKYHLMKAFDTVYKRLVGRNDNHDNVLEVSENLKSERFIYILVKDNSEHTVRLFGKVVLERFESDKYYPKEHILETIRIRVNKGIIITVTRSAVDIPYVWKDPYRITVTFTRN